MGVRRLSACAGAVLLLGAFAESAHAAAITVVPTTFTDTMPADSAGTSVGMCATPGATPCSLRQAINLVQNNAGGGTVDLTNALTPLTYQVSNGPLLINAAGNPTVKITGPNPRLVKITDAGAGTPSNLFTVTSTTVTISGVTITGGAVSSGSAANGGAIINGGVLTLNSDQITGNSATGSGTGTAAGGAIVNNGGATLSVSNSTITGNTASAGTLGGAAGGAISNAGTLNISNSTITGNTAGGDGSASGGGISQTGGTLVIASTTLNGNTASSTSVLPNQANGGNLAGTGSSTQIKNTIISGGAAGSGQNCTATVTTLGYNLEDRNQCGFTGTGDQINTDPKLQPLGPATRGNNFTDVETLAPTSPAIDHGNPAGCTNPAGTVLTTDQVANPRGTPCDIGAYEMSLPPVVNTAPTVIGTPQTGQILTCYGASFFGIQPITATFAWLRNGVAIAGATGGAYAPAAPDVGQAISCAVTASNVDGTATATSAAVTVALPPLPPFDGVTLLKTKFTLRNGQVILPVMCSRVAIFGCGGLVKITTRSSAANATAAAKKKKHRKTSVPHPSTLGTATFKLNNSQTGTIAVLISHDGKLEIASRPHGRQAVTIAILAYDGLGRQKLTSYDGEITAPASTKKSTKKKSKRRAR